MASPRQRLRLGCVPDGLLLVLLLAASASSGPVEPTLGGPSEIPVEVQMPEDQVVYDQRQNGTENLRVQMSGVTVVLAPAEAVLAFASSDLMDSGARPKLSNPSQPKSRLTNLLMGFLNKGHH
ncbi:hypothetical protein GE061_017196 [Apolygus lucorum]|uniref:Uncharacterized protein n=1 Tax=Apolygus lucorum TaxID=248454 RepID=A0A6A4JB03_APOLU|nr:hypothetical protein GE061_017196 [Apolygus lucorum]